MTKHPNVIVCMCDQLRSFEVGCYGSPVVKTPHIDALAGHGVRFDIAVSNDPVCTPGRSCLLSGQYSRTCTGNLGNENDEAPSYHRDKFPNTTLPEAFREAGYRTALIGKWHVGAHPKHVGFDECVYPKFHHLNRNQMYFDGTGRAFISEGLAEDYNITQLDGFLESRKDSREPFFAYYNIATPHMPYFDVPEKYTNMYSRNDVVLRDNVFVDDEMAYNEKWFSIYLWDYLYYQGFFLESPLPSPFQLPEGFDLRDLTAMYYGMVSYTDSYVGAMMNLLQKHALADDTVVVFTSDHGDNMGSHHRFNKDVLMEEAIRIPLIFQDGRNKNAVENTTQVAALIDVMPTLLSMCGIDCPPSVQGRDVSPLFDGSRTELDDNYAFIETSGREIGIRTPAHLYGAKLEGDLRTVGDEELRCYDLRSDPYQLGNLAKTGNVPQEANDMRSRLLTWNEATPWMAHKENGEA